jgi:hypothetical protein
VPVDKEELDRRRVILAYFCKELDITPDEMTDVDVTLFELTLKLNAGELQPRTIDSIKYLTEEYNNERN